MTPTDPKRAGSFVTMVMLVFGAITGLPLTAIVWMKREFFLDPAAAMAKGVVATVTPEMAQIMLIAMLSAWAFGLGCLLYGLFRLLTKRRLPWAKAVLLIPALALLYSVYLFSLLPKP